jgi:50S ribosomal subunit-associated GTPase HflX
MRVSGKRIIVAGFFSAREKDWQSQVDQFCESLSDSGATIVGTCIQRRGVSRGGVQKMDQPFDRKLLISKGKVEELIKDCEEEDADAVVFINVLDSKQRHALANALPCSVGDKQDVGG